VLENRKLLREKCPQVDFLITSTTSVFNILHLPDFHRNWVEAGWIDLDELIPHTLKHPQIYNIQILPTTLKEQAATKIIKHIEWIMDTFHTTTLPPEKYPNLDAWRAWATRNDIQQHTGRVKLDLIINEYQHALTYMFEDDLSHLTQKFRQRTEELDMLREENFITTFPELKALWEAALS
jgi:hypothetical protein